VSLTLACVVVTTPSTSWYTGNDKSRMILGRQPTCGTAATGEILRFGGRSRLIFSQGITLQKPAFRWYSISSSNRAMALGVRAVGCGPCCTAASMTSQLQSGPQSTAMPCLHSLSVGVKGCMSAKG
jgi:hypothetical protein